jgi:lipoprotein-anchoring transpeptidase ErfK/SrfK
MTCFDLAKELKKKLLATQIGQQRLRSINCIVVSIDQQKLWHFKGEKITAYTVSTARAGAGCVENSQQTPLGVLQVSEKIGAEAPLGMIFKGRKPTGELWQNTPQREDNLITSRILWLEGLEPGHNAGHHANGQCVDTKQRYIYIHGTNQHHRLGQPNSHGCVLLSDADVIQLFDEVPVGTLVYIHKA